MNKGLILSLALSLSALTASADLMHVTAQGTVSSSYKCNHNTGTQIDGIVQAGTTVQYSFIFDTDQNATFTSPDGTVYQYNDYSQYGHSLDYFYADFQGSYVLPDNGNTTNTGGYDIGIEDLYLNGTYSAAWLMSDRNSNHYAWMYNSSNNDTTTIDT
jgi:hypothetical protein